MIGWGSTFGPIRTAVSHMLNEGCKIAHLHLTYVNPLPHVLMLTAIVVMVGTFGVALSFIIRIYRAYGTIEEKELLAQEE